MMNLHRIAVLLWVAFALLSTASGATNMRNPLVLINSTLTNETSSTVPGVSIVNPGLLVDDFIVLSNGTLDDDDTPHEIYVSIPDQDNVPNLSQVSITVSNSTDGGLRPDVMISTGNHTIVVPGWTIPETKDTSAAARERRQLSGSEIVYSASLMDSLVAPVRRLWPEVQEAGKRFSEDVVPSIGNTLNKMGGEMADVVKYQVLPTIEESILELSNGAVPVINRGIDLASEGIERGTNLISRATAKGMQSLGIRVLGRRRHHRLARIVNRLSYKFNDTVARFTNALTKMVEPPAGDEATANHDYAHSPTNHNPDYYYYHDNNNEYDSNNNNYYDLYNEYSDYNDWTSNDYLNDLLEKVDQTASHEGTSDGTESSGVGSLVRNTAFVLASNILGQNLTRVVAPLARSVSKSVGETLPAVSYSEGRIVIDLPGTNTVEDSESRPCTTPDNHDGLCKDLSDCPDLILNLTNLRRSVCFKGLFTPGVCCAKSALRTTDEESTTRRPFLTQAFSTQRPSVAQPPQPRPPFTVGDPRPPFTSANSALGRPSVLPAVHPNARFRCGVPRIPEQRVVGGEESSKGKWPWMAAIFLHGPKKTEFWCGASLVSASYVLTAAHCTRDPNGHTFNPQQFTVRLGDHNIFSSQDDHLVDPHTFRVEEIRPHPDFKARGFYNDVALLKLKEPVNFSDYIVPICLPPPDMVSRPLDHLVGQAVTVVGYGSVHYDGQESAVPRDATLPIWRNSDCDAAYLQPINEIFLCAGFQDGGKDACQGDSGGPLLLYGPSQQWVQVGIVSFGNRCAEPGYPGVYTRITAFMPWIHKNMLV